MYKIASFLIACLIIANTATAAENHNQDITKETLLKTDSSWEGTKYAPYPVGTPQITMLRVTVKPNTVLKWHTHPCISAVYMTEGNVTLVLKKTGQRKTFNKGDSFTDTVDIEHQGQSGTSGAEMLVFFACADKLPLTVNSAH
ncbi:cupin [Rouxiella silvae]|jgi:quercetin dioxygenase-like cupin family protein|uniref:Cupin n=1 Tax=Rouxiella silvae TaxID=1646373 RepID=A0ABX3U6K9_9GAMM|nr:cupin domain-containing protein [Rouxiella silvae]KQN42934.1 cupin [Serratia sp. Leaf50]ORJ23081.1 cupin [Rouxiella silvae]